MECTIPDEVDEIKEELIQTGYIKNSKKANYKKSSPSFNPTRYLSSEGYEIYVGRNNIENDYLTFKFANSRPDKTITQACIIAAFHSKAKASGQIAIDYSEVKNIKKPNGTPPGFVNYFKYYSAYATADVNLVKLLKI